MTLFVRVRRVRHGGEGGESLRLGGSQVLGPLHAHQLPGNSAIYHSLIVG
jgi:hypothetical protein